MSLLAHLVHRHLRSPVRGQTRLTRALAQRSPALQRARVDIEGARPLFLDLRDVTNHGLFRDSPHRSPPWEWATDAALRQVVRPGDVVLDVGTNRGLHAVALAAMVGPSGRVVCVEPNPALLGALQATVAATPWMSLLPIALSDADREATLFVGENHEMGSLGDWMGSVYGEATRQIATQVRTLDGLVAEGKAPRPAVIKIDVEGNELRVFQGARSTLDREDAPVLLYEANVWAAPVATGEPATAATRFLAALPRPGYGFHFVWEWGLVTPLLPDQVVHGNILAVPRARHERWPALQSAEACAVPRPGEAS